MSDVHDPDLMPARTPDMEDHQQWVWMNGSGRWEIRGTGAFLESPPQSDKWRNAFRSINLAKQKNKARHRE